jgi:hypothetical protein
MAYDVTPDDIRATAYGVEIPTGSATDAQLTVLIAKATTRIDEAVPSLAARVTDGTVTKAVVQDVIEDMVLRVVKNPKSLRSLGLDDFQATIDQAVSTGMLYLSDDERSRLLPHGRANQRLGTVRIGLAPWRWPGA